MGTVFSFFDEYCKELYPLIYEVESVYDNEIVNDNDVENKIEDELENEVENEVENETKFKN